MPNASIADLKVALDLYDAEVAVLASRSRQGQCSEAEETRLSDIRIERGAIIAELRREVFALGKAVVVGQDVRANEELKRADRTAAGATTRG